MSLTKERMSELLDECVMLYGSRNDKWKDTFESMPAVLASLDTERQGLTGSKWCADMAALKLKRFYESECISEDSLKDCICYLAMSLYCVRKEQGTEVIKRSEYISEVVAAHTLHLDPEEVQEAQEEEAYEKQRQRCAGDAV